MGNHPGKKKETHLSDKRHFNETEFPSKPLSEQLPTNEQKSFFTSHTLYRVQNVIQFRRGSKHQFYCVEVLQEHLPRDVVNYILQIFVRMVHSEETSGFVPVSTYAGVSSKPELKDGPLVDSLSTGPFALYIDPNNCMITAESHTIRCIDLNEKEPKIMTVAGCEKCGNEDGTGEEARFQLPVFIVQDAVGDYLILESHGHQIRKLTTTKRSKNGYPDLRCPAKDIQVSTVYSKKADGVDLNYPHWIGFHDQRQYKLMCSDTVHNDLCYIDYEPRQKVIQKEKHSLTSTSVYSSPPILRNRQSVFTGFDFCAVACFNTKGELFVCDYRNHVIKKLVFLEDKIEDSVFAGMCGEAQFIDGIGECARFHFPNGVSLDVDDYLLVSDAGNNAIRRISPSGHVITIAGTGPIAGCKDGKGKESSFQCPTNIAIDNFGDLFVADWKNNVIRKIIF
jgi:hypothetical protein